MISDTSLDELQAFGDRLGLKRAWIHFTPGRPHYDLINDDIRRRAIEAGALRVGRREFVAALRRHPDYQAWQTAKQGAQHS